MDGRLGERHGVSRAVRVGLRGAVFGAQEGLLSMLGALTGIAADR